jgi:hypothetical protein
MTLLGSRRRLALTGLGLVLAAAGLGGLYHLLRPDYATRVKSDFMHFSRLGDDLSSMTPAKAVELMIDFQRAEKYSVSRETPYGDALLFEAGVYNWGQGEHFEFKMTRQLIFPFGRPQDADDHIVQLSLILRYRPEAFSNVGSVSQWDAHLPAGSTLREFVLKSAAFAAASAARPYQVALESHTQ